MEGHDEQAQELEYEVADLEKQGDSLADDIHGAKDEWEAKKRDSSVPGAGTGEQGEDLGARGGTPDVEDEDA